MTLTDEQQQLLEDLQEQVSLKDSRAWQLFRSTQIEAGIARINETLLVHRQKDYEAYITLWSRREALQSILNTLDASIPKQIKDLEAIADTEPDTSPATGELI